jgi:hypothetical protein
VLSVDLPYVRCVVGGLSHMLDVLFVDLAICQVLFVDLVMSDVLFVDLAICQKCCRWT